MTDSLIKKWIRPEIQAMSAYHVAPASGMLKLDAMENPFDWPQDLKKAWADKLQTAELNRYPDPAAGKLVSALRQNMSIPDEFDLLLGNGSDEIIQMLAMAVAAQGNSVLAPEPSFVMYKIIAEYFSLDYRGVQLQADFDLDVDAMIAAIRESQPALIFLAQPNNPTGNVFSEEKVRAIIDVAEGLVIVDEAYTAFTENNSLPLLHEYHNVVVMRTLSKVGLAGLRLGLIVGRPELINELNKTRLPYNINSLTQLTAEFALQNYSLFEQQTAELCCQRTALAESLSAIEGVSVFPSEANFILIRLQSADATQVHQAMKDRGVLVKNLNGGHSLLQGCLRLTVGSEDENRKMLEALQQILAEL